MNKVRVSWVIMVIVKIANISFFVCDKIIYFSD